MKNQYIGDIGDYGKYGLLRFLRDAGVEIGVNWYLTDWDETGQGGERRYLKDARMRVYDPALYDALGRIAPRKSTVKALEQEEVLSGLRFYHAPMRFSTKTRTDWHQDAMEALSGAALIFADPDNGLTTRMKAGQKGSEKYILPEEIETYYRENQDIVYYQHRPRKNGEDWLRYKQQIKAHLPEAELLALSFHRYISRAYIFVLHPEKVEEYQRLLKAFLATPWGTAPVNKKIPFTAEPI
ncbi:MAG: hypothetical protein ACSW8F_03380 [bacterium]